MKPLGPGDTAPPLESQPRPSVPPLAQQQAPAPVQDWDARLVRAQETVGADASEVLDVLNAARHVEALQADSQPYPYHALNKVTAQQSDSSEDEPATQRKTIPAQPDIAKVDSSTDESASIGRTDSSADERVSLRTAISQCSGDAKKAARLLRRLRSAGLGDGYMAKALIRQCMQGGDRSTTQRGAFRLLVELSEQTDRCARDIAADDTLGADGLRNHDEEVLGELEQTWEKFAGSDDNDNLQPIDIKEIAYFRLVLSGTIPPSKQREALTRIAKDSSTASHIATLATNVLAEMGPKGLIATWWHLEGDVSPAEMLQRLRTDMTDRQLARMLTQLCATDDPLVINGAFVLAIELSDTKNQCIVHMALGTSADAGNRDSDIAHVKAMLQQAAAHHTGRHSAHAVLVLQGQIPPSRQRLALARISSADNIPPEIAELASELLAEMRYSNRRTHGAPQPMSRCQAIAAAARWLAQGWREGTVAQFAARVAVQGSFLYLSSVTPPWARLAFVAVGTGVPQLLAFMHFYNARSEEYKAHPSKSFNALQAVAIAGPLLLTVGTLATGRAMSNDALIEAGIQVGEMFAINAMGRAVRAAFSSWSQSSLTAGVDLVHADGVGLTAQEQQTVNCVRDGLYVATSVLLLAVGPNLAKEWLAQTVKAVAALPGASYAQASLLNIFSSLSDMCEAWTVDAAKVVCKTLWGKDYVLKPGTQPNPGLNPQHFYDHAATRIMSGTTPDIFNASAKACELMKVDPAWAIGLQTTGAIFNGLVAALRGRVMNIVRTDAPLDQEGSRNPAGLLSASFQAAQWVGGSALSGVQWVGASAVSGLRSVLPGSGAARQDWTTAVQVPVGSSEVTESVAASDDTPSRRHGGSNDGGLDDVV